jgi:transposase-like protein
MSTSDQCPTCGRDVYEQRTDSDEEIRTLRKALRAMRFTAKAVLEEIAVAKTMDEAKVLLEAAILVTNDLHVEPLCPSCASSQVTEQVETVPLLYGSENRIELRAHHPVLTCHSCDFTWTDERAEVARTAVVESHKRGEP